MPEISNSMDIEKIPKILCVNKCDLPNKQITLEEVKEYAQKNGMKFFETSAKENINVKEGFDEISTQALVFKNNQAGSVCGKSLLEQNSRSIQEENKGCKC